MGDGEVVGAHLGLKQVGLWSHAVDVGVHDRFYEVFVVQSTIFCVLIEEHSQLIFAEVAAELIQALFEGSEVSVTGVSEVEVRQSLLSCLPLICLAIALQSNLLEQSMLNLPQSLLADIIFWFLQAPSSNNQLFKVLSKKNCTLSRSLGMQKFS